MTDRVDVLRLHLKVAPRLEGVTRSPAEDFCRRVLELAGNKLTVRKPGRIVVLRQLPLRWRLRFGELNHTPAIEGYAEQLASALESIPPGGDAQFPEAEVFQDESEMWAAFLSATAQGTRSKAWAFEKLGAWTNPIGAIVALDRRDLLARVLLRLDQQVRLIKVLSGLAGWDRVIAFLSLDEPASATSHLSEEQRSEVARQLSVSPALRAFASDRARRLLVLYVEALQKLGGEGWHEAALEAVLATEMEFPGEAEPNATLVAAHPLTPKNDAQPKGKTRAVELTEFAGLFYLLNPVLELDLASLLWEACLSEHQILAAIFEEFVPATDPAVRCASGYHDVRRPLRITSDQRREIASALFRRVTERVIQNRDGDRPPIVSHMLEGMGSSYLGIALPKSPFALYVEPVASDTEARQALSQIGSLWPGGTSESSVDWVEPVLSAGASEQEVSLLTQLVGSIATLFLLRTGDPMRMTTLQDGYLQGRGLVETLREEILVRRSMDDIDVTLRRTGWDRNPGWVPWLRRTVRFVFESGPDSEF